MRTSTREINYQVLGMISDTISSAGELADVCQRVVAQLSEVLGLKGCTLFLLDRRSKELQIAATHGLSQRYLNKGPISAIKSIAASLGEGPVAIYQVSEDPRLQYPKEAVAEGISSILSVPLVLRGKPLGILRLYTAEPWEFKQQDLTFATAIAQMLALLLDNLRVSNAYKKSVEVLKVLRRDEAARAPLM